MDGSEKFVQVRLERPYLDENGEQKGYHDYVCWIPLALAEQSLKEKKPIRLYFEDLDEWRENYRIVSLGTEISKEKANDLHRRNSIFRRFRYAGRPSFKD
jgi:hypothetical protein